MVACGQKDQAAPAAAAPAGPPPTPTLDQLKGAAVSGVFDQAVTLANGRYDGPPAASGAASHPTLVLWEPAVAFGDMDGTARQRSRRRVEFERRAAVASSSTSPCSACATASS